MTHILRIFIRSHPTRPKVLTFDHINPPSDRVIEAPPRTAILYASLNSPNFRELHSYLLAMASATQPRLEYIFRHKPASNDVARDKTYLSGYGVTLDLKKTDYLVLDDRRPKPHLRQVMKKMFVHDNKFTTAKRNKDGHMVRSCITI